MSSQVSRPVPLVVVVLGLLHVNYSKLQPLLVLL